MMHEMSEKLTEEQIKNIIREEIEPKLDEIKASLDDIVWTEEMEDTARRISHMDWKDWFRPFTI